MQLAASAKKRQSPRETTLWHHALSAGANEPMPSSDCLNPLARYLRDELREATALVSRLVKRAGILAPAVLIGPSFLAASALAFDVEPGNYLPFPSGTNLVFGYYQYFSSGRFITDNGTRVPDSELTA